ncbi:MAG: 30S ribosomal protein S6 [Candidatus Margulisbacteria bacterium]|nr:30S ribosomal protein S6 [Candidatus Margulisiibacteriota bacterium]
MRRYETIIIIRPNTGEDDIAGILDKTTGIIESNDGSIVTVDKWGLKKLAYLIKKEQQGYYVLIEYAGKPAAVAEMERIYRIDDKILKFMTIKTQDVYTPDAPKEEGADEEVATATEEEAATIE